MIKIQSKLIPFGIFITLFFLGLQILGLLSPMEWQIYDALLRLERKHTAPNISSDQVLVLLDEESLDWLGSWPWPRSFHARLIEQLKQHGADKIVLDIIFDAPQNLGHHEDLKLQKAIAQAQNVYLARMVDIRQINPSLHIESDRTPLELFSKQARGMGFTNALVDSDGRVRRSILDLKWGQQQIDSLAWAVLEKPPIADLPQADFLIPFQKFDFIRLPYNRVLDGSIFIQNPNAVRNKTVWVGASAALLHDLFPTPLSGQQLMPGVEILAFQAESLRKNNWNRSLASGYRVLILIGMGLSMLILMSLPSLWGMLSGSVGLLAGTWILSVWMLHRFQIWTHLPGSITLFLISFFMISLIGRHKDLYLEKLGILNLFKRYFSRSIAEDILSQPLSLKGEKREISVLFSDLKNFTRFAKKHSPDKVAAVLNRFFEKMNLPLTQHQAVIDKYMGDGIMAFWHQPSSPQGVLSAIRCALQMLMEFEQLQKQYPDFKNFELKMGIDHGNAFVGNLGSALHMNYTVIGDVVNTAARLESLSIQYKPHLLITERALKPVKKQVIFQDLKNLPLKGKRKAMRVYLIKGLI